MQLYLPRGKFRDFILQECHDTRYAGHLGVRKIEELINRDFYWPTIHADVTTYVQTCEKCQRNKPSNQRLARIVAAIGSPRTTLGEDQHGFHYAFAQDQSRV